MTTQILAIIPARGGSKGIPRKNLRSLNNRPLISYAISCARSSKHAIDVYVSTEDPEIKSIASKLGAGIHDRNEQLSLDAVTLDPVIYHAWKKLETENGKTYQLIITLQPTSPLLRTSSLDAAIDHILDNPEVDTTLSAKEDTHLTWKQREGHFVPNYSERLNRQYLEPVYTETGGFVITRPRCMSENGRIGAQVHLYLLSGGEEIDVDTHADWSLCEYHLRRRKVLFVVAGYPAIGLGHVYRTLLLANGIMDHHVSFLVTRESELAYQLISRSNYEVYIQEHEQLLNDVTELLPDVVINDILDTEADYIQALRSQGITSINFEDVGEGSTLADLVVNALYPMHEGRDSAKYHYGHPYFCARDEFLLTPRKEIAESVRHVLITFGGTDENKLTRKVLEAIGPECLSNGIKVHVVLGLGYDPDDNLEDYPGVEVARNVNNISDYMLNADIIFTSAGRTVYEISCIGTPTIIMSQNAREETHFFASEEHGFLNLGRGTACTTDDILDSFQRISRDHEWRQESARRMEDCDVRNSRSNVMRLLRDTIEKHDEIQ